MTLLSTGCVVYLLAELRATAPQRREGPEGPRSETVSTPK